MEDAPECELPGCNNLTNYSKWNRKFNRFCSKSHSAKHNSLTTIAQRNATCLERYGTETPQQSDTVKKKAHQTNLEKYGKHPSKLEKTKEKTKETMLDRFGYENVSQSPEIKQKKIDTCKKNYGVEYYAQTPEFLERTKSTCLDKYGTEFPMQCADVQVLAQAARKLTCKDRYGTDHHARRHWSSDTVAKLDNTEWLSNRIAVTSATELAAELGVSYTTMCRALVTAGLSKHMASSFEASVHGAITKIAPDAILQLNNRVLLGGKELDIYLPEYNLAIECNGAYWHSEQQGKGRKYHLNKTAKCAELGIHLMHIWDYQWYDMQSLIVSRLQSKMNKNETVYGRRTAIQHVSSTSATQFLTKNHIQGNCSASVKYGLYYNNELVALMTFGKSRYNKNTEWELIRYCSKQGVNVVGGASKLFKYFVRTHRPTSVISYSDKMWNTGGLYEAIGFTYSHTTDPAYHYTRDYILFENRVAYQKHKLQDKLEVFDLDLTEWQNMQANGFDRIWDCGNDVWVYTMAD